MNHDRNLELEPAVEHRKVLLSGRAVPATPSNGRGYGTIEVLYGVARHEFSERPFDAIGMLVGPQINHLGDDALQFRTTSSLFSAAFAVDDFCVIRQRTLQGNTNISHFRAYRRSIR